MPDQKLRVFVDPASYKTGWAAFRGSQLIESGSIEANKKEKDVAARLAFIFERYREVFARLRADEVRVEQFGGKVHHLVLFSVGVILAAAELEGSAASQSIPVASWQSYTDWHGDKLLLRDYDVFSEDERAAIGMGLWYLKEK